MTTEQIELMNEIQNASDIYKLVDAVIKIDQVALPESLNYALLVGQAEVKRKELVK